MSKGYMDVLGHRTEDVRVQVHYTELFRIITRMVHQRMGIDSDAYLQNGKICCDDRNHYHGSVGTTVLKEVPTEQDLRAFKWLETLEEIRRTFTEQDKGKLRAPE